MLKTIKSKFIFFSILLISLSVGIPNYFLIRQFQENFRERSELYLNSSVARNELFMLREGIIKAFNDRAGEKIIDKIILK